MPTFLSPPSHNAVRSNRKSRTPDACFVLALILEAEDQSSSPGFVFCLPDAVFYLQIVVLSVMFSRKLSSCPFNCFGFDFRSWRSVFKKYSILSRNLRVYGRPANGTSYRLLLVESKGLYEKDCSSEAISWVFLAKPASCFRICPSLDRIIFSTGEV